MKPSIGLSNLRQIARLGYDGRLVAPTLAHALESWIGVDSCTLIWVNELCQPTNAYAREVRRPDVLSLYLSDFFGRRESDAMPDSAEFLFSSQRSDTAAQYGERYYRSDFYQLICREIGMFHALRVAIRSGSKPVAVMVLGREQGTRNFSAKEIAQVHSARPFFAHALSVEGGLAEEKFVESSERGIAVIDGTGAIQHATPETHGLLRLISGVALGEDIGPAGRHASMHALLRPLARQAHASFRQDEQGPPSLRLRNAWGEFVLRAYPLTCAQAGTSGMTALTVSRFVPLSIKLLSMPALRDLPMREKEVCLLLAQGLSTPTIAARMALSPHTITTYIRSLYRRFDVGSRNELLIRLLAGGEKDGGHNAHRPGGWN